MTLIQRIETAPEPVPPPTSRYWRYPQYCDHNYVREYLTSSTTTAHCRGCGAFILDPTLRRFGR